MLSQSNKFPLGIHDLYEKKSIPFKCLSVIVRFGKPYGLVEMIRVPSLSSLKSSLKTDIFNKQI